MPRSKTVTVNGKQIVVKEAKVKELRGEILPKIGPMLDEVLGANKATDLAGIVPVIEQKLVEFFPDLTEKDLEESYPSEIEALVEAFIEVNFTGIRRVAGPLLSLIQAALLQRVSG